MVRQVEDGGDKGQAEEEENDGVCRALSVSKLKEEIQVATYRMQTSPTE